MMDQKVDSSPGKIAVSGYEWDTHRLNDVERAMIETLAGATSIDPYLDPGQFRNVTRQAWDQLAPQSRQAVIDVGQGSSKRPELYLQNLPASVDLPPTPTQSGTWECRTNNVFSEFVMVMFSHGLGSPTSYLDQRNGQVFHDIFPTVENVAQISSQSSEVELGYHTEMFFHPSQPSHLMLHCLRSDAENDARTFIASTDDLEAELSEESRTILREPRFALDLARLHGNYKHNGRAIRTSDPRPVIPVFDDTSPVAEFRFEPCLMTPIGKAAAGALEEAEWVARATAVAGALNEEGLLILDNRRAAHARSPFTARFDGNDRWLRRVMIREPEYSGGLAVIPMHDLELLARWRSRGVAMETIPYQPLEEGGKN